MGAINFEEWLFKRPLTTTSKLTIKKTNGKTLLLDIKVRSKKMRKCQDSIFVFPFTRLSSRHQTERIQN